MKTLAALLVLVTATAYAFTPIYNVDVDGDKTVRLTIENDSESVQLCSYKVSWLEGLKYKRFFGKISLLPEETKVIEMKNDIATRIMRLSANVDCE